MQGSAHDVAAVSQCLKTKEGKLVDEIGYTSGEQFVPFGMGPDGPDECKIDMSTLLEILAKRRRGGFTGQPHIVVCSTTGMSRFARDTPPARIPLYHVMLKVPHADEKDHGGHTDSE